MREKLSEIIKDPDLLLYGMENAPDGVLSVNEEGEIIYANERICEYLNYSRDELIGKNVIDIDPNFSEENWKEHWEQSKKQKKIKIESKNIRKDGSTFPVSLSINHISYQGRELHLTFVRDITEEKEKQAKLERARDEYQKLINGMSDAVFVHDLEGNILTVNDEAIQRLGYNKKELLKMSPQEIDVPEHAEKAENRIKQIIEKGKLIFESVHKTKGGDEIPVEISSSIIKYRGEPAILSIARDITERKEAQKALEKSERHLRKILENIHLIAISLDRDGKVIFCNNYFVKLTGWSKDEILGKDWFENVLPEDIREETRQEVFQNAVENGEFPDHHENKIRTKQGEKRIIEWSNTVQKNKEGEIEAITAIGRDLTEKKKAQKEKEEMRQQMFQAQKLESVGHLAGGIAHDFNNLLTVIQGHIQMSRGKVDKSKGLYSHLEQIDKAANRAADLTRQLLLFSRKKEPEFEPADLNNIIADLQKMLARLIGEDIFINMDLDEDLWTINADKGQIEQVVTNLCLNARDAMKEGGKLFLSTRNVELSKNEAIEFADLDPGEYVRFKVEDTGIGMEPEIMQNIFDPFFTTKEEGEGSGMGLSVVHGIVKNHEGEIYVESEPGEGAVFKIYFPASPGLSSKTKPEEKELEKYEGEQEGILIVEDDKDVLTFVAQGLSDSNYRAFQASDAQEAFRIYKRNREKIDLLLSDIIMPGVRGDQLADKLQEKDSDLKVILTSGYTDKRVDISSFKEKEYEFIQKPYELKDILKMLHDIFS